MTARDPAVTVEDAMTSTLEAEVADETALLARRADVEQALAQAQAREAELEAAVAAASPRLARAQETWYRLAGLRERFRGTASVAAERQLHKQSVEALDVARSVIRFYFDGIQDYDTLLAMMRVELAAR